MATHSSTLAWKIPWTEKPGRLQSRGWQRVGHDWATSLSLKDWMCRCRGMVGMTSGWYLCSSLCQRIKNSECQRILLCWFSSFIFSSFSFSSSLPSFFPSLPYFCSFMNSYIVWEHISTNILHEKPLHVSIWKFHYCQGNLLFSEQQTAMMNGTDERGLSTHSSHSSLSKNSICVAVVFVQSLNSV